MSKESAAADDCPGCGRPFAFAEYHAPHCPGVPPNLVGDDGVFVGELVDVLETRDRPSGASRARA